MLITTICRTPVVRISLLKQIVRNKPGVRFTHDDGRKFAERVSRRPTLRERAMAPPSENAYGIGKGAIAGGAAIGLGALCFYGLGLSNETNVADRAMLWPQLVKDRIKTTYLYFGGSLVITAASAVAVFRTPALLNLVTRSGWLSLVATMAAMIGTGHLAQSLEYSPGLGVKQGAWMLHSAVLGAVLAPMCFLGGPILVRAAWYTAGVVGGLSTIAVCAPSEKFLSMGAPLGMGLGVVVAASLANMWLPPTTALGAGLYSISLYGGLLLFSGFLLYDTQRIVKQAELYPANNYGIRPYDPVNAAISIYLDTINIFVRIAMILSGAGGNKRRN